MSKFTFNNCGFGQSKNTTNKCYIELVEWHLSKSMDICGQNCGRYLDLRGYMKITNTKFKRKPLFEGISKKKKKQSLATKQWNNIVYLVWSKTINIWPKNTLKFGPHPGPIFKVERSQKGTKYCWSTSDNLKLICTNLWPDENFNLGILLKVFISAQQW